MRAEVEYHCTRVITLPHCKTAWSPQIRDVGSNIILMTADCHSSCSSPQLVDSREVIEEVSDDISSHSLPTRLVSVAALLRRYSPSPHPLLRLLSHVPSSDQSLFAYYSILPCESCQLYTTVFSGGPSRLPGNPNTPPSPPST